MQGKQIIVVQLTGLRAQPNANYATKKERGSKVWVVRQGKQTEIHLHLLLIIHLEISIQNISLVLSCEPHPKCKPKATDNCIKRTLRKVNNLCNRGYKHRCFPLVATAHPLDSCFCHSSQSSGGMNPQSSITFPLGVTTYYLAKAINSNREHARITSEHKYKRGESNILLKHNLNVIS